MKVFPYYLANRAVTQSQAKLKIADKYTNAIYAEVALADAQIIDRAIAAALVAEKPMAEMAPYERRAVLEHVLTRVNERQAELADLLCIEAGKPIKDARGEVTRLMDTFRIAMEEATRIGGEVMPLDITPRTKGYRGFTKRVPIGACSFISPFNFPLNLAAHKIAPAIAAGCPFVLKPASLTPLGALVLGEILAETALPPGAFSILPCPRDAAELFVTDERLKLLSFTGSAEVGWAMKARAGKKKVTLELGGNAAVIIDSDADIDAVVPRIVFGAFYQSGQSCISVQRILVHESLYEKLRSQLVAATASLKAGNPHDETTFIGPMISETEARRLKSWIDEAAANGARILTGGQLVGTMLEPTLAEGVAPADKLCAEEAFGPAAVLETFSDFDEALQRVNRGRYGLQAGIFTRDIHKAMRAWDTLEVGGVVIGDVPSFRVDNMPYGGVKDSGLGREGIRSAIEDMTEVRLLVIK
ncbi:aldehyde dehydrogenase family protein [Turneriella parva]|uniref:Aldehyde Dehydrogenase n=1 Tax=Turneriella parva (strain ATCC BAA-1111 / DSM 21527 / NCTC 11395 / H) TaxID=869212 RepID=I4B701_TURPD|nr:aldehyde dehydrogenase family protein [Turneriella parva]AFM13058.1 Aldehyde Dehydrogenase [Turneriella parva DSM 21527]